MSNRIYKNEVAVLSAEEIKEAFQDTFRQYVQGNLKKEQKLSYVYSERTEIGISDYDSFCHDEPHYHDVVTETNYVISGKVGIYMLDTGEEYVVEAGGVFSFPPKVRHVLKMQAGTRIIFVKDHSIDDKHVIQEVRPELNAWYAKEYF